MISDELLNKFDRIEDLPVSEEMLGAYLEGNLHGSEFREIQNYIHDNDDVLGLIDIVENDIDILNDIDESFNNSISPFVDSEETLADFDLPEIEFLSASSLIDASSSLMEDIILGGESCNFIDGESHIHHLDNTDNNYNHHNPELDFGRTDNIE